MACKSGLTAYRFDFLACMCDLVLINVRNYSNRCVIYSLWSNCTLRDIKDTNLLHVNVLEFVNSQCEKEIHRIYS